MTTINGEISQEIYNQLANNPEPSRPWGIYNAILKEFSRRLHHNYVLEVDEDGTTLEGIEWDYDTGQVINAITICDNLPSDFVDMVISDLNELQSTK